MRFCLQPVAMQLHARDMMSAVMLMIIVVLELTIMTKLGCIQIVLISMQMKQVFRSYLAALCQMCLVELVLLAICCVVCLWACTKFSESRRLWTAILSAV